MMMMMLFGKQHTSSFTTFNNNKNNNDYNNVCQTLQTSVHIVTNAIDDFVNSRPNASTSHALGHP